MIIAVDFDGVIANYDTFRGERHCGGPVDGVKVALDKLDGHTIIVNTCRAGVSDLHKYMERHNLPYSFVNFSPRNVERGLSLSKIAADIYIDDKAICFKGNWAQTLKEIERFKVWYK